MPRQIAETPERIGPKHEWPYFKLWENVKLALKSLPAHFQSGTSIEGINATDIFTLNSALGATIENQVVETLNASRTIWDPDDEYGTYAFLRQPQSFPDVILKNISQSDSTPIMGIELKGWYLLAKEGEPSMRFRQTAGACADADLIMVVPWVLNNVISGRPRVYTPYIELAKYAAQYRNYSWELMGHAKIKVPQGATPYPKKKDATNDDVGDDKGGNFGRIARCAIMDDYIKRIKIAPLCGIQANHWLEFFKIFHQDVTETQIKKALDKLRGQVETIPLPEEKKALIALLQSLQGLTDTLNKE